MADYDLVAELKLMHGKFYGRRKKVIDPSIRSHAFERLERDLKAGRCPPELTEGEKARLKEYTKGLNNKDNQ